MDGTPTRRRKVEESSHGPADDYVPQSRAYYNPNVSPSIVGRATNARFHVNHGMRGLPQGKRALGRVQSENDIFRTTQDDLDSALRTMQAEAEQLCARNVELQPYFNSNPSSPSLGHQQDSSNPFLEQNQPLTDFGNSMMDVDEECIPSSQSTVNSTLSSNSRASSRKRKSSLFEQDDDSETDVEEESQDTIVMQNAPRTDRIFKPSKRALAKTQSLPSSSFGSNPFL